jgi:hypothetical protein
VVGLALWLGWAVAVVLLTAPHVDPSGSDFHAFYDAARAWRGLPPEGSTPVNLNTPLLAPLMAPVTWLPLYQAFLAWSALGLAAIVASLSAVRRYYELSLVRLLWVAGALVILMPALEVWVLGQITWCLLYPFTRAWLAADRSPARAGLWLAPVILLKPPLALVAIALPWRVTVAAGVASVAMLAGSVVVQGPEPWLDWAGRASAIGWINYPLNASFWGWASRLETGAAYGGSLGELSAFSVGIAAAMGVGVLAWCTRATGSLRWVAAVLWGTLVSPLGWIYYLPLALGPALASWRSGAAVFVALALLSVPMSLVVGFNGGPLANRVVHSTYAVAVLLLSMAWLVPAQRALTHTTAHRGIARLTPDS